MVSITDAQTSILLKLCCGRVVSEQGADRASRLGSLAEHFTISVPQNPSIDEFYVVQKLRVVDC